MFEFFTALQITLIVGVAAFVAGVVFSTKVKDAFKGIPADLRKALSTVEADTVSKVKAAQASVLADLASNVKAAVPALPQAPIAPTPIPVPVTPAPAPTPVAAPKSIADPVPAALTDAGPVPVVAAPVTVVAAGTVTGMSKPVEPASPIPATVAPVEPEPAPKVAIAG